MGWDYDGPNLYSTAKWKRLRLSVLKRDGFTCQMCGAMLRGGRSDNTGGIMRPAVVDHLIPHRGSIARFYDGRHLWSVCCDCHDGPCQAIEERNLSDADTLTAKLSHKAITYDGTHRVPINRWVDAQHGSKRLMIW